MLLKRVFLLAVLLCQIGGGNLLVRADSILSLAGEWRFALDPDDTGVARRWWDSRLPRKVQLPGTLPGQGIGEEIRLNTPWIGSIVDRSFFDAPHYAPYR